MFFWRGSVCVWWCPNGFCIFVSITSQNASRCFYNVRKQRINFEYRHSSVSFKVLIWWNVQIVAYGFAVQAYPRSRWPIVHSSFTSLNASSVSINVEPTSSSLDTNANTATGWLMTQKPLPEPSEINSHVSPSEKQQKLQQHTPSRKKC